MSVGRKAIAPVVTALLLLGSLSPALAETTLLWDNDVLVRVDEFAAGHGASALKMRILTADYPSGGWVDEIVPFTADGSINVEPDLAALPGMIPSNRWMAMVWVRTDLNRGRTDLALHWMLVPSWVGEIQWLTNDESVEQGPRLLLDSRGVQHVLYRRAEDGHLIIQMLSPRGRTHHLQDLSETFMQGRPVGLDAYDFAFVDSDILFVAAPDDQSGDIVLLSAGIPPWGGETIPVPLQFRDPSVLRSTGGTFVYENQGDPPVPSLRILGGDRPLVTWKVYDLDARQDTLHYRYVTNEGTWSRWARLGLDEQFGEKEALDAIRGFINRLETVESEIDIGEIPPQPGLDAGDGGLTAGGSSRSLADRLQ